MTWLKPMILAAIALTAPQMASPQASVKARLAPGQPPLVLAHRAADLGGRPENSLAAIRYAIDRGIEAIHINPQLTADDHYILMHDATLNRTTNVEAVYPEGPPGGPTRASRGGLDYVRDYSLPQIGQLRLLDEKPASEEPVPTLGEALDVADGRLLVLLGLKSYETDSLAAALAGRDTRNLLLFELYFSGTDQTKLRQTAEATGIGIAISLFRTRNALADFETAYALLGPSVRLVTVAGARLTPELAARLDELGIALMIGSGGPEDSALARGDPDPWRALLDRGFSASTDYPELLLEALGK